jgi:hypothetical protein
MQYMLMIIGSAPDADEDAAEPAVAGPAVAEPALAEPGPAEDDEPCWAPWAREVTARGIVLKGGAQLQPASMATTVSLSDGDVLLSDGPFAETKEQIVGYDIIECADLDEAIFTASRHPVTLNGGRVEIRPIAVAT